MGLPWAGIAFWKGFFGLNCAQMAPGRAESDFGPVLGWIDTLGLKQIFLIFSVVLMTVFQKDEDYSIASSSVSIDK